MKVYYPVRFMVQRPFTSPDHTAGSSNKLVKIELDVKDMQSLYTDTDRKTDDKQKVIRKLELVVKVS